MVRRRRKHSGEFKAQVGLEALSGEKTIQEIAQRYEISPIQVSAWKKAIQEQSPNLFNKKENRTSERDFETERNHLHAKIGQLTVENEFMKKKCQKLSVPLNDCPK